MVGLARLDPPYKNAPPATIHPPPTNNPDENMKRIEIGDVAPDFELPAQTGQRVRLSDYRDKQVVVLYFYPRDDTPVCTKEACRFRDAFADFTAAGAVVLGVSADPVERHRAFAQRQRLPFLLLSDAEGAVRKAFGVPKTLGLFPGRVTYVIDKEGTVRHLFQSQLDADGHVREALEMVKQLAS
jgi:peroxiredoxin Q/BCP